MRSSFSQYKVCNKSCGIAYNFTILIKNNRINGDIVNYTMQLNYSKDLNHS